MRPPELVTRVEKRLSMAAYGDRGSPRGYEYDHLIPLELGGAPNDPRNLWPEPGASPNPKDAVEYRLREDVCGGAILLATAQQEIARAWVSAYRAARVARSAELLRSAGYSVVLNSQIAIASITSPISSTIPASSSAGTWKPHHVTPGSSARRAAGETVR